MFSLVLGFCFVLLSRFGLYTRCFTRSFSFQAGGRGLGGPFRQFTNEFDDLFYFFFISSQIFSYPIPVGENYSPTAMHRFYTGQLPVGFNVFIHSDIYCHGELLDDVQMQQLYPDSKTFVDKKLRRSEAEIVKSYRELKLRNNGRVPTRAVLTKFVEDNFIDDPLVEWVPPDFVDNPSISTYVQDSNYK